jgi:hypothetical protein
MPQTKLSPEIIAAAIRGFEARKEQIDHRIAELRSLLNGGHSEPAAAAPPEIAKPRKKRSAAVRRKMALAQRARYAKLKHSSEPPPETAKPKRKLSAAGRKRIIEATKKRWAAVRAAKEAEKPAVVTKARTKRA